MNPQPFFLAVLFLFLGGRPAAQTLASGPTEASWHAMNAVHQNHASSNVDDNKRPVLQLSGDEAVMPVYIDDKTTGVVKVNSRAALLWRAEVKGFIIGLARMEGNIVALYVPFTRRNYGFGDKVPSLSAVLLDGGSGAVKAQKQLIDLKGDNFADIQVHTAENGELQQVLVRYTRWNTRMAADAKVRKDLRQTEKIECYTLGADLSLPAPVTYANRDAEAQYLASATAANGVTYVLWATDKTLEVEHMTKDGSRSRLSTPFEWNQKEKPNACFKVSPANPQQVVAAVDYESGKQAAIKSALFSFDQKKVKVHDELLTGDYRGQLEGQLEVPEGFKASIDKRLFEKLAIVDIAFYQGQPIVVKETRGLTFSNNNTFRYYNGDLFISLYDGNMTPQKNFFVNKFYEAFLNLGRTFGYQVKDNAFRFMTNDLAGPASYVVLYGSIDLQARKWERLVPVRKGTIANRSANPIDAAASIWFANGVLVSYLKKPLLGASVTSSLQLVTVE